MSDSEDRESKMSKKVDVFLKNSWTGERDTPEFEAISRDLRELDTKLRERRNNPRVKKDEEFSSRIYGAVHNLLQATHITLDEPMDVGKFAGGEGREKVETPGARVYVIECLVTALNYLGMDGEGIREALKDSGDY